MELMETVEMSGMMGWRSASWKVGGEQKKEIMKEMREMHDSHNTMAVTFNSVSTSAN